MAGQDLLPIAITDKKGGELCRHQASPVPRERHEFLQGQNHKNEFAGSRLAFEWVNYKSILALC